MTIYSKYKSHKNVKMIIVFTKFHSYNFIVALAYINIDIYWCQQTYLTTIIKQ